MSPRTMQAAMASLSKYTQQETGAQMASRHKTPTLFLQCILLLVLPSHARSVLKPILSMVIRVLKSVVCWPGTYNSHKFE